MKTANISLSIILPTLNEIENLKTLVPELVSVAQRQNLDDYEIIIVDDNSSDGTENYVRSLQEKDKNIKILVALWTKLILLFKEKNYEFYYKPNHEIFCWLR